MSHPCRHCQTLTAQEFCSTDCYDAYKAETEPCPECGQLGWDCICHDEYEPLDGAEQIEDVPCPHCGELDYPCDCGYDEPANIDDDTDFDPYAGSYDDGRYDYYDE